MDEIISLTSLPTPIRSFLSDDPSEVLGFAIDAFRHGSVALATLVEIRGGAARALGSHVCVAASGRFCGYVSGGCVEAAVACEALLAINEGRDRVVRFGEGSPFFDIVLPCGGGITVVIHVLRDVAALQQVLFHLEARRGASLRYTPTAQSLEFVEPVVRAFWINERFTTVYRPLTRVVVSGHNIEAARLRELALAARYEVADPYGANLGTLKIDAFTAVVVLQHDLEAERSMMNLALRSPAFYIGTLGSTRTHRKRVHGLRELGWEEKDINRLKAPVGIFGPTRDSSSLALSVLADIAATRLATYG